jgi:hypothetical protein
VPTLISPRAQATLAGEPDPLDAVLPPTQPPAWPKEPVVPAPGDSPNTVTVTSLEVGSLTELSSGQPLASAFLVAHEADGRPADLVLDPSLSERIKELTEINMDLRSRLAVLEAQNELLRERLKYNDELILNLTGSER